MMVRPNWDSSPLSSQSGPDNVQIFNDQQQQINDALNMSTSSSFSSSSYYNLSSPSVTVAKPGKILHDQTSDSEMTTPYFTSNDSPNPKSSAELVREITSIEIEILHLEGYLLSLYRTAYQHGKETPWVESNTPPIADSRSCDKVKRISGSNDASIAKSSSKRVERIRSGNRSRLSLGDRLIGTSCTDGALLGGPDRLSEDIVKCISSIYCKLGDPNQCHQGPSDSSASSLSSSSSTTSTRNLSDTWSPACFNKEKGPNADMIQVLKIGLDDDSFDYASKMLKHFRTLIKKLEIVNPGKMKREQKLAFWINIHNALVMHAHLAYGTHNSSTTNSILKATYNVGGHCINAHMIQSSILGIRSHFRASWLQSLLSPGRKLPTTPSQHVYAIEYSEPLVHFALSLGSFSDPAVRIYKAKNVFQDLKVAKEEFIRSTVYIHKESKIYIPKILYYFAKDIALTMPGLFEMINACLPKSQQQRALEGKVKGKPDKYVCWLSQSSIFRYVIHRDAIEGRQFV